MSESGAGETKVDGKAHEEGDEICRTMKHVVLYRGHLYKLFLTKKI